MRLEPEQLTLRILDGKTHPETVKAAYAQGFHDGTRYFARVRDRSVGPTELVSMFRAAAIESGRAEGLAHAIHHAIKELQADLYGDANASAVRFEPLPALDLPDGGAA